MCWYRDLSFFENVLKTFTLTTVVRMVVTIAWSIFLWKSNMPSKRAVFFCSEEVSYLSAIKTGNASTYAAHGFITSNSKPTTMGQTGQLPPKLSKTRLIVGYNYIILAIVKTCNKEVFYRVLTSAGNISNFPFSCLDCSNGVPTK